EDASEASRSVSASSPNPQPVLLSSSRRETQRPDSMAISSTFLASVQVDELIATKQHVSQVAPGVAGPLFAGPGEKRAQDGDLFRRGRPAEEQSVGMADAT